MAGIGTGMGLSGVLALRAQILERSQSLGQIARTGAAASPQRPADPLGSFSSAMGEALKAVNGLQSASDVATTAYERGETHDIAEVMLARQKASIAFEATLQARNRLLGAYRDILNMPV
ncbi:flagellar hook-basal body complex protein FliE [Thermaurantiacus sp.]